MEEGFEPGSEAAASAPHTLGDRADATVVRRVQMQDPVGFAVADRAQDNCFGFQRAGQTALAEEADSHRISRTAAILCEVMKSVTIYTTEHCSLCVGAKTLLDRRGISYEEVNLARDPDGRERLSRITGMFTFPQILIDGEPVGGFAELLAADREGRLGELLAA
jgi:glutaredoxin 3